MLIQKLTGKLEQAGIGLTVHEESDTSKCSFLDKEPMKKHDGDVGKRVKWGLFRREQVGAEVKTRIEQAGKRRKRFHRFID